MSGYDAYKVTRRVALWGIALSATGFACSLAIAIYIIAAK